MASVQLLASMVKGPVIIQGWDDKLQGFLVGEPTAAQSLLQLSAAVRNR